MISDVPPRHDGGIEILFLLFSETVLFCARGVASRDIQRAHSQQEISHVSLRRSINECYPRYPSLVRMRHVSSSIYNCCLPRNFCVVEKRTLLLRLSERPGRPRFVNNSLINKFLIFFVLEWACFQESSLRRALMFRSVYVRSRERCQHRDMSDH